MLVPRENDSVRFYVQLPSQYATREGRVDRSQFSVQDALKVGFSRRSVLLDLALIIRIYRLLRLRCTRTKWSGPMKSNGSPSTKASRIELD